MKQENREKGKATPTTVVKIDSTTSVVPKADYTAQEEKLLKTLVARIVDANSKAEGLAQTIASSLWEIDAKRLYRIEGYTGISAYATDKFGMSKGTVSNAIAVIERFADKETGVIKEEYASYKFSTLMVIKSLSDTEIRDNITPTMSRDKAKEIVKTLNGASKEQKKLTAKVDEAKNLVNVLVADKGMSKEEVQKVIKEKTGKDVDAITASEVEEVLPALKEVAGIVEEAKEITLYTMEYASDISAFYYDICSALRKGQKVNIAEYPQTFTPDAANLYHTFLKDFER